MYTLQAGGADIYQTTSHPDCFASLDFAETSSLCPKTLHSLKAVSTTSFVGWKQLVTPKTTLAKAVRYTKHGSEEKVRGEVVWSENCVDCTPQTPVRVSSTLCWFKASAKLVGLDFKGFCRAVTHARSVSREEIWLEKVVWKMSGPSINPYQKSTRCTHCKMNGLLTVRSILVFPLHFDGFCMLS